MTPHNVLLRVPPSAGYLALLRATVSGFAARENFTLEQVDDLRMAVEEAAVQLLRKAAGSQLSLDITAFDEHVEVRLYTDVNDTKPVVDPGSFSWMILRALADDLRADNQDAHALISLTKRRMVGVDTEVGVQGGP